MRVSVPAALRDSDRALEELVAEHLPASQAALAAAARSLFFSLPVAFAPPGRVGPSLGVTAPAPPARPSPFLDMGPPIPPRPFGENDPRVVRPTLGSLRFVTPRSALSK